MNAGQHLLAGSGRHVSPQCRTSGSRTRKHVGLSPEGVGRTSSSSGRQSLLGSCKADFEL